MTEKEREEAAEGFAEARERRAETANAGAVARKGRAGARKGFAEGWRPIRRVPELGAWAVPPGPHSPGPSLPASHPPDRARGENCKSQEPSEA